MFVSRGIFCQVFMKPRSHFVKEKCNWFFWTRIETNTEFSNILKEDCVCRIWLLPLWFLSVSLSKHNNIFQNLFLPEIIFFYALIKTVQVFCAKKMDKWKGMVEERKYEKRKTKKSKFFSVGEANFRQKNYTFVREWAF